MVEHVLAKDGIGVRFPVSAHMNRTTWEVVVIFGLAIVIFGLLFIIFQPGPDTGDEAVLKAMHEQVELNQ